MFQHSSSIQVHLGGGVTVAGKCKIALLTLQAVLRKVSNICPDTEKSSLSLRYPNINKNN